MYHKRSFTNYVPFQGGRCSKIRKKWLRENSMMTDPQSGWRGPPLVFSGFSSKSSLATVGVENRWKMMTPKSKWWQGWRGGQNLRFVDDAISGWSLRTSCRYIWDKNKTIFLLRYKIVPNGLITLQFRFFSLKIPYSVKSSKNNHQTRLDKLENCYERSV